MEREAEDVESACNINKNKEVCVCEGAHSSVFLLLQTVARGLGFTEQLCALIVEPRDREEIMRRNCIASSFDEAASLVEGTFEVG